MTILKAGQTYTPRNSAEIAQDFRDDILLEARAAGYDDPPIEPGTDWWILSRGLGAMAFLVHGNVRVSEDNSDVFSASGEPLDNIREAEGLRIVPPAPSRGSIDCDVVNTVVVPAGLQGTLPNGKRFKTTATKTLEPSQDITLPVITIDTGKDTRTPGGTTGLSLVSPPVNLGTKATVSTGDPLTGGTDGESDEQKRARILNKRQNLPAAGNWAAIRQTGLEVSSAVQGIFVYPALGGPGSRKVVVTRDIDTVVNDYSRVPATDLVNKVRTALFAFLPSETETVVQAVAEETTNVTVQLTIPESVGAGGNGQGWVDDAPWPPLNSADQVTITSITGSSITVDATTATSPIAGNTTVAWWSTVDQRFYTREVISVSGSSGAWVLGLDAALVDSNGSPASTGEYISPAALNIEQYGITFRDFMRNLGPGENTSDSNRLPRAARHPFTDDEWPSELGLRALKAMLDDHTEISDAAWVNRSKSSPTVPGSVSTAPNILTLNHFGIYKDT